MEDIMTLVWMPDGYAYYKGCIIQSTEHGFYVHPRNDSYRPDGIFCESLRKAMCKVDNREIYK